MPGTNLDAHSSSSFLHFLPHQVCFTGTSAPEDINWDRLWLHACPHNIILPHQHEPNPLLPRTAAKHRSLWGLTRLCHVGHAGLQSWSAMRLQHWPLFCPGWPMQSLQWTCQLPAAPRHASCSRLESSLAGTSSLKPPCAATSCQVPDDNTQTRPRNEIEQK